MKRLVVAITALSFAWLAPADDLDTEAADGAEQAEEEDGIPKPPPPPPPKYFTTLPVCTFADGSVEVKVPGSDWQVAEEKRFYPLGASFRTLTQSSKLVLTFGKNCLVTLYGLSSFATKAQPLDDKTRTIVLGEGELKLELPQNMQDGYFFVTTPGFKVGGLSGESKYVRKLTGDGDEVRAKCASGSMSIEGRHFSIVQMRAQNVVRIRMSHDMLFTCITGLGGDYMSKLDQGLVEVKNYETGVSTIEQKFLDWKISPQTNVRIHRAVPKIGEKLAVTTMTFDASGVLCNSCSFVEERFEVNTGETAPIAKERKAELAKKAQEASESVLGAGEPVLTSATDDSKGDDSSSEQTETPKSDDDFDF